MSSVSNITFTLEICDSDKFEKYLNSNLDRYTEIDNSHWNIWAAIKKNGGAGKYINESAKGSIFSFAFAVNYFNFSTFLECVEDLIKECKRKDNHCVFSHSFAILINDYENGNFIIFYKINEEGIIGETSISRW